MKVKRNRLQAWYTGGERWWAHRTRERQQGYRVLWGEGVHCGQEGQVVGEWEWGKGIGAGRWGRKEEPSQGRYAVVYGKARSLGTR